MRVMFSGQDGEYGLESEEVVLTPEDENPLRRILQVRSPSLCLYLYVHTRADGAEHARSATLRDLGVGIMFVSYSPEVKHLCHPHTGAV